MIGRLRGEVVGTHPDGRLLIDVGGVGYEVFVPLGVYADARIGDKLELSVHTHVREDQITLFGFSSFEERELFRRLLTIAGVGAKTALALLSTLSLAELAEAIEHGDAARIARTPGIGRKTAERIVLDLRGALADWLPKKAHPAGAFSQEETRDLRAALAQLGYRASEIEKALAKVQPGPLDEMLRAALKALAQ